MDKINIKFTYNDFKYCYRVPENLNWFEMFRFKKITEEFHLSEYIIYNEGKILLEAFIASKDNIIDFSYRTLKQRRSILYEFIKTLIMNKVDYNIILKFANKLDIDINEVLNYDYSMNATDFFNLMSKDVSKYESTKNNIINEVENIINNNSYNVLGIEEKEYSKEELSHIFNNKMNLMLDAYNSIKKEIDNKTLKK